MGAFDALAGQQYISLETVKRSGERVATPVWFAVQGDGLCITTAADSGKVKRIRHTPRGRLAPCTSNGALTGDWIEAEFRILAGAEASAADDLLSTKYGLLYRLFAAMGRFRRQERTYLGVSAIAGA